MPPPAPPQYAQPGPAEYYTTHYPNSTDYKILDIPGAAVPVTLVGLDGARVSMYVGARKVWGDLFSSGSILVPLVGGGSLKIKCVENLPGYPIVKFKRRVVYAVPKPPFWDRFSILAMRILPFVIGIIPGWFIGLYTSWWVTGMVKRGESVAKRRLLPLLLSAGMLVSGVGIIVLLVVTGSFAPK